MEKAKVTFKNAWPYGKDKMNLPVENLDAAIPFYETIMGFQLVSKSDSSPKTVILSRDNIQIGLAENGGDPSQDGCFFEVDNVESSFAELKSNGWEKQEARFEMNKHGDTSWKVFFVIAPDGLCYCLGERQG
jgi:lactoylglutathione lyase